jgi:hypothetical protein
MTKFIDDLVSFEPSKRSEEILHAETLHQLNSQVELRRSRLANVTAGMRPCSSRSATTFVRVTTNVKKDDGSRAIGTILDPNGPAIAMIKKGEAYYGETTILGKPYMTGYEPIRDASNHVVGIYYVGYALK